MAQRAFISALVCLAVIAQTAAGAAIPKRKAVTPQGTTGTPTLQQILDGLVVSGPAIDSNAPSNVQLWTNTSGPATAQVVESFTGKQSVKFGIYDPDSPGDGSFLLDNKTKTNDITSLAFNDDNSISIKGGKSKKANGFDGPFGFFAKIPGDTKHDITFLFTQPELNGGLVGAKVFQGNGLTMLKFPGMAPGLFLTSQFLIAFETLGKDGQFNDFIVSVSGLSVPEPALALLFGMSLAALCARRVRST
jgi:hypothetical protein